MKKLILLLIGAALLFPSQAGIPITAGDSKKAALRKGSMTISCSPDLQKLAASWVSGYTAINPEMKIEVVSLTEPDENLAFVSNDYSKALGEGPNWKMVIGRDPIIPVINSGNPLANEIFRQGISKQEFSGIFGNQGTCTWSALLEGGPNIPANIYLIDNESIKATIAGFVSLSPASIKGIAVADSKELLSAIQKDPNAIGFCKLTDIADPSGQIMVGGISLLPIDKNANGKLDYMEKIYDNVTGLSRGIWLGKYPKALNRNIYALSTITPGKENEIDFLKYVLTSGQEFLALNSLSSLSNSERISLIDRLPSPYRKVQDSGQVNVTQLVITILAGFAIIIAILSFFIRYRKSNNLTGKKIAVQLQRVLNANSISVPKGLFFDKTHTWAFMETDGTIKVGIDDFLQHVTGEITSVKLKKQGEKVKKGDPVFSIVQKGKRLNISAPVSGIILANNPKLFTDSSLLNTSPFADGWIYRIEPTNWIRENQFLFMAEKYSEWIRNEFVRLKDFLTHAIQSDNPEYAYVILQDGGEIKDNILENQPPEVWEDFQTKFIDTSK